MIISWRHPTQIIIVIIIITINVVVVVIINIIIIIVMITSWQGCRKSRGKTDHALVF